MHRFIILLVLLCGLLFAPAAQAEPFSGSVLLSCDRVAQGKIDPIVSWGAVSGHEHALFGSTAIGTNTTFPQLLAGGTACEIPSDKTAWWVPAIVKNSQYVYPTRSAVYYRGGNRGGPVTPFPPGIRWVSGNPANTGTGAATWRCSGYVGRTIPQSGCPVGVQMDQYITSCWDGMRYGPGGGGDGGPANGRDHMLAVNGVCPAGTIRLPELQIIVNWPPEAIGGRLSSDAPLAAPGSSQHADYFSGWSLNSQGQSSIDRIVSECLNMDATPGNVTCTPVNGKVVATAYNTKHPDGAYITD